MGKYPQPIQIVALDVCGEYLNWCGTCVFLYNEVINPRDQCEIATLRSSKTVIIPPLFEVGHVCRESTVRVLEILDRVVNIS